VSADRWRFGGKSVRVLRSKDGWIKGIIVAHPDFKDYEWFTPNKTGIAASLEKAKLAVYTDWDLKGSTK
jgi:hypothetical protein